MSHTIEDKMHTKLGPLEPEQELDQSDKDRIRNRTLGWLAVIWIAALAAVMVLVGVPWGKVIHGAVTFLQNFWGTLVAWFTAHAPVGGGGYLLLMIGCGVGQFIFVAGVVTSIRLERFFRAVMALGLGVYLLLAQVADALLTSSGVELSALGLFGMACFYLFVKTGLFMTYVAAIVLFFIVMGILSGDSRHR